MHPRLRRRLRPIAAVVLVFFTWFSIEPWNYALAAQDLPPTRVTSAATSSPRAPTAAELFESNLRSIKEQVRAARDGDAYQAQLTGLLTSLEQAVAQSSRELEASRRAMDRLARAIEQGAPSQEAIKGLQSQQQTLKTAVGQVRLNASGIEGLLRGMALPAGLTKDQKQAKEAVTGLMKAFDATLTTMTKRAEQQRGFDAQEHQAVLAASMELDQGLATLHTRVQALAKEATPERRRAQLWEEAFGKRDSLLSADREIRKEFDQTEAFLKEKSLPQEILDRHEQAVAAYETQFSQLRQYLTDVEKAHGVFLEATERGDVRGTNAAGRDFESTLKDLGEFLNGTVKEAPHQPQDPNLLPTRTRELKRVSWLNRVSDWVVPPVYAEEPAPPGPEDLSETLETPLNQEIQTLAADLDGTPVRLYEYVRNLYRYEPYPGSVKGAIQTLRERAGNEWDLASLLIALYRASGIPARYVVGIVEMPIDQAMSWLGVEDPQMAASILLSEGRPTSTVIAGGHITALRFQHVWVQAYVPFLHSRGALAGPGDTWVDLDPSFKRHEATQTLTLSGVPLFDQASYLSALRSESPVDFYRSGLQTFLDPQAPGYVPDALARNLEIVPERLGILVGQLPYAVKSVAATYSAVPDTVRQTFALTVENAITGEPELLHTASLPALAGKRVTLSYSPATATDAATVAAYGTIYAAPAYLLNLKPQLKVENVVVAEGSAIGAGREQTLRFTFGTTLDTAQVLNTVVAGEYYAIGLNPQAGGTHEHVLERSKRLHTIAGTINLADPSTLDDRLGELLYLSTIVYHENLDAAVRTLAPLSHVVDVRDVSELMAFLSVRVDSVFGVPRRITPSGITLDMDRNTHLIAPVDGDLSRIAPYMQLHSTQSSHFEHQVTEGIYQTEALSAVKIVGLAQSLAIPVHTITPQNLSAILPQLQLDQAVETDIQNAVNAGKEVITPQQPIGLGDWTGVGYVIQDPERGSGAYLISGGYGGAATVYGALIQDLATEILASFATNAYAATDVPSFCYPGVDNAFYSGNDDVCFKVIAEDLVEDVGPCLSGETAQTDVRGMTVCRKKYAIRPEGGYAAPLIEVSQGYYRGRPDLILGVNAPLTKNITALQFRSQDGARYMRAGSAVMLAVEVIMEAFRFNQGAHGIDTPSGAGYRTPERNETLGDNDPNTKGDPNSYHMNGTAVDLVYEKSNTTIPPEIVPDKCAVLGYADRLIGPHGGVLDENRPRTIHISIPSGEGRDKYYPGWKGTKCQWP
ncbi:MAG: transglutaminase domain-containing protein [Nitrospirota bacterium]